MLYPAGPSTPALPLFARPGPRRRPGLASSTGCGGPCASYRDGLEIDLSEIRLTNVPAGVVPSQESTDAQPPHLPTRVPSPSLSSIGAL